MCSGTNRMRCFLPFQPRGAHTLHFVNASQIDESFGKHSNSNSQSVALRRNSNSPGIHSGKNTLSNFRVMNIIIHLKEETGVHSDYLNDSIFPSFAFISTESSGYRQCSTCFDMIWTYCYTCIKWFIWMISLLVLLLLLALLLFAAHTNWIKYLKNYDWNGKTSMVT